MSFIRLLILLLLLPTQYCFGQQYGGLFIPSPPENLSVRAYNIGDSAFIIAGNCKSTGFAFFTKDRAIPVIVTPDPAFPIAKTGHSPLIRVHGNLLYGFDYRSYIDTPFAQNDLMQHLVQSTFSFVVKEKYPVKMVVTSRTNNSPYFNNTFDVSFQFNRSQVLENIKAEMRSRLTGLNSEALNILQKESNLIKKASSLNDLDKLINLNELKKYEEELKLKKMQLQKLQTWVNDPARMQSLVEEKEKQLRGTVNENTRQSAKGGLSLEKNGTAAVSSAVSEKVLKKGASFYDKLKTKSDSLSESLSKKLHVEEAQARYDSAKKLAEKLQDTVKSYVTRVKNAQKKVTDSINKLKQELNSLTTGPGLYAFMKKHHLDKGYLTKAQRVLLSVNQVGIGRTSLDYSELTVKNISIAGVNVEMNPVPVYAAIAAGKVNYRFRDFIYKNKENSLPPQSVALIRIGVGQKEKNNLILTFFEGKKSVLNPSSPDPYNATQKVYGISAETKLAINANNYIVAEFAKSSYYYSAAQEPTKAELRERVFNFRERSNEAYSFRLFSQYPQTNTRITAYYKKLGEHFQSFTLYPSGINQEAWMARISQQFWKKRITLDAAIRQNDFVSPVAMPSYNSKAVFKSVQLTVRVPHYPFVSIGYYPSSQLLLGSNHVLTESQYNTLNAVVSHNYTIAKKLSMNTTGVFTKFYNSGSDTGFIYFNAASYSINQSVFLSRLQLLTGITVTEQQQLHLLTLEQSLTYSLRKWMSVTGGLKCTRENHKKNLLGIQAAVSMHIKKIGTLQMHYEKTYLPAYNRELKAVDMANFSLYREF